MSFDNSKETLNVKSFVASSRKPKGVNLDDYTPGEISYLASKICNMSPTALPCKPENTARVRAGMRSKLYSMMPVEIYKAVRRVTARISLSDFDATGSMNGKDSIVVVSEEGSGFTRVFEKPSVVQTTYSEMFSDLEQSIKDAENSMVWTGGVRVTKGITEEELADKQIDSMMNSLVKYKPTGAIENNCLSGVKMLDAWKLEGAAKSIVETIGDTRNVPKDFVYSASQGSSEARRMLRNRVAHSLGPKLKNTILTVPDVGKDAVWTRKMAVKPQPFNIAKPIQVMSKLTSSIGESRIGVRSMSQVDGLPVAKETRKVMAMLDDVDIPSDVNVVKFVGGTKNQCERLWRRYGYREDLLFVYPQDKQYSGAKFAEYFRNGQVRKGGVVCYHTADAVDYSQVKLMYLNLTLTGIEMSKRKELGEICKTALQTLKEKLARSNSADYVCIYANVFSAHHALWKVRTITVGDKQLPEEVKVAIPGFYGIDTGIAEAKWYGYVSTRYAASNFLVTNYQREELDPIPIERLPHVYVNMLIFHHIHPIMRHVVLTYPDAYDGKKPIYRMFRPVRYYQLADEKRSELLSMEDFALSEYFVKADNSFLPEKYASGVPNSKYEGTDSDTGDDSDFEGLGEGEVTTEMVVDPVASCEEVKADADVMARLLAGTKQLTLGDMKD